LGLGLGLDKLTGWGSLSIHSPTLVLLGFGFGLGFGYALGYAWGCNMIKIRFMLI